MGGCIRKQVQRSTISQHAQGSRRDSVDLARERFQFNTFSDLVYPALDPSHIENSGRQSPSWISFQSELGSQKQIFLEEDPSCPICVNNFDEVTYLPRILPCGHAMCNACVMKITKLHNYKYLRCPQDRKKHRTKFITNEFDDRSDSMASELSGSLLATSINTATYIPVTLNNDRISVESSLSSRTMSDSSASEVNSIQAEVSMSDGNSLQLEHIYIRQPCSTQQSVVSTWNSERQNPLYQSDVEVLTVSSRYSHNGAPSVTVPSIYEYKYSDNLSARASVPQFVSNLWSNDVIDESSHTHGYRTTIMIREPSPDYSSEETLSDNVQIKYI